MKKETLLDFISKYNLNGLTEGVVWNIEDKVVTVEFASEDTSILGKVRYEDIDIDDVVFGLKTTTQFKKKLNSLSEDIKIKDIKFNDDKESVSLTIVDSSKSHKKAIQPLSATDEDVIDNVYPEQEDDNPFPDINIELNITPEFVEEFISCKNAIDRNNITFITNGSDIKVVFGYSGGNNTDLMEFDTDGNIITPIQPTSFNSDTLKAVLMNNKDFKTGTIKVAQDTDGVSLMFIDINYDNCNCEYIIPCLMD